MYRELIRLLAIAENHVPKYDVPSTSILHNANPKLPSGAREVLDHINTQVGVMHFAVDKTGILRLVGTQYRVETGCGISYLVTRIGKIPVVGRVVRY